MRALNGFWSYDTQGSCVLMESHSPNKSINRTVKKPRFLPFGYFGH